MPKSVFLSRPPHCLEKKGTAARSHWSRIDTTHSSLIGRAFEPLSPEEYEAQGTRAYLDAYRRLEAGDPSAMPAFAALLGLRGDDQLVSFHLKRLLNGATGARIMLD